jgi:6-pyruvoyltetrahydropterin/6-carboxytetrahydropterin synthase
VRSTICKSFTFHAAHVIPHHRGKCSQPHGHTYKVEVEVVGRVMEVGPEAGMVADFDRIKQVWAEKLEPELDHRDLNETLVATGKIPYSTAECLADYILAQMRYYMAIDFEDFYVASVRVWETPTSWAQAGV